MARPLKSASRRFLLRPLNVVFGAPGHIAVLRALHGASRGLTGREVARAAGIAQGAAMNGLDRLEAARLVRRTPAGRAYLFDLDRDHRLLKWGILPLLDQEASVRAEVFRRLRRAFERDVVSGCVFGSVARGEDGPESDLDVCLIVGGEEQKERLEKKTFGLTDELRKDLGILASFLVFTRAEFIRGTRVGNEFFRSVIREGERFAGRSLEELKHDEEDKKKRR